MLPLEVQTAKLKAHIDSKDSLVEQGLELQALQDRNETLFFNLLINNIEQYGTLHPRTPTHSHTSP